MTRRQIHIFAVIALIGAFVLPVAAQERGRGVYMPPSLDSVHATVAEHGMVVAQEKIAARIGADVLRQGGNAVDAAVATGFAMAVTYPRAGNIGGGGFMVVHLADRNEDVAIDYRETAPGATTRDIFLGSDGKPDSAKSLDSGLGIGVPGTVAGFALALEKYGSGRFTLAQLLKPSIDLARDGFLIADDMADTLPVAYEKRLKRWPDSVKIFSRSDGTSLRDGDRLVQPDLAATLTAIAEQGPRGFYEGAVADRLIKAVNAAGGIMTLEDLKSYQPIIRAPVRGNYRGYEIVSMPLPSSGGTVLLESLNILEGYPLSDLKQGSPASLHLLIEAMKRAYADRARYLGDPAFVNAPTNIMLAKDYAARQRASIDPDHATAAAAVASALPREGSNTTHYSIVDRSGNAVSNTYTLNFPYGVGLVADGTGVLLNNELDDFTAAPGASNAFGLVGFEPNLPGPGKRPLSSMSPTIVLKDGKPVLLTGTPGGSRIISAVLQVIVNVLDYRMDVAAAVAAPRLHNQWLPDVVRVENGFSDDTLAALKAKGHQIVEPLGQTSANSILVTANGLLGAPDPRTRGAEAAGQ
jgi:gamma-glutamyltranspeptidase / glutathione hydrolase